MDITEFAIEKAIKASQELGGIDHDSQYWFEQGFVASYDHFIPKILKWISDNTYFYINDFTGTLDEENLVKSLEAYINLLMRCEDSH